MSFPGMMLALEGCDVLDEQFTASINVLNDD
jgi:hypothetical protein